MKQLFVIGVLITCISCFQSENKNNRVVKTILVVLAHPDDETAFGPILSRFANENKEVYLVIATDGRYGVEDHAGISSGDRLAAIRKEETICASEILGINPPIFLEAHDSFGILSGINEYFEQTTQLKNTISRLIEEINPDVIMTFGPDGDTGHLDHKGISDLVTEIIVRNRGWYEKYPLYYLAWPKEKEFWIPQGELTNLNYVDLQYRNVHLKYNQKDQSTFFESLHCYKSQFTSKDINLWIMAEKKDTTYTMYFREFSINNQVKTTL